MTNYCSTNGGSLSCFVLTEERATEGLGSLWLSAPTNPVPGIGSLWVGDNEGFNWIEAFLSFKCEKFGKFCGVEPSPETPVTPNPVPLPAAGPLLAFAIVAAGIIGRRKNVA